jgi:hypothetical protein
MEWITRKLSKGMIPTIVVRNQPIGGYTHLSQGEAQRQMVLQYKKYMKSRERLSKQFIYTIRTLEKNLDYCALLTTSLPKVNILDDTSSVEQIKESKGPYVVRAMASKRMINHAIATNQDYIFLENGYFGNYKHDRNTKSKKLWHRVCVNELQQEEILKVDSDRWDQLLEVDEKLKWTGLKKDGGKILLVVPSIKPCLYYNQNVETWKQETIEEIKKHTDKEIVIREKGSRTERTQHQTIYQALDDDIFCVVTYQSIAAVEALAYGIPVFTLAPSAAKKLSLSDLSMIETPYYPDADLVHRWCCSLAYGQFTRQEMLEGKAWSIVLENINRDKISY